MQMYAVSLGIIIRHTKQNFQVLLLVTSPARLVILFRGFRN